MTTTIQGNPHKPLTPFGSMQSPMDCMSLHNQAIDILKQNRITAPMVEDIRTDGVALYNAMMTPTPKASHRFKTQNEGDLETIALLNPPEEGVLLYATIEFLDLSAPTSVTFRIIDVGQLIDALENQADDPYWVDEYSLAKVGHISLTSSNPMSQESLDRLNWFNDPEFHKIGHITIGLQNWIFSRSAAQSVDHCPTKNVANCQAS